jgi:acyl-coenzyme A thioesterase PaaI-like protein
MSEDDKSTDSLAYLRYGFEPPQDLIDLAASVRNLVEKMLVIEHSHDELVRAKADVDAIAERLSPIGRKGLNTRLSPLVEAGPEDERPYFAGDLTRWHYNPFNPPVRLEVDAGVVRATVNLGLAYEGPPGLVHGGHVAMLLDQLLGQANGIHGVAAMTGTLTVKYRRPTPLMTDLVLEATPPEVVGERKCITRGVIRVSGEVTAEAEGLFVLPDLSRVKFPHLQRRGR